MQKLVFRNGAGNEIDLTSGNFGITNWAGLSNTPLNIQTQQVPFEDGGVFLDALMEQREIDVTVAIQDNNDLELRYQLKRELISALNPKLGEGVLIYTNDHLSKQIHAVPQIPLFENKNSNDKGTLKASVAFSCPSPYWEDVEETEVFIPSGIKKVVDNGGDVPCELQIEMFTTDVTNPQIKNITENKKIELNGTFHNGIIIDTKAGQKSVRKEEFKFSLRNTESDMCGVASSDDIIVMSPLNFGSLQTSKNGVVWDELDYKVSGKVIYEKSKGLFIALGGAVSPDGINWSQVFLRVANPQGITYSKTQDIFVAVGYGETNGEISTSPDGTTWTKRIGFEDNKPLLYGIAYSDNLDLFVAVGANGAVLTSSDYITWTEQNSGVNANLRDIIFSRNLNVFIAVGDNGTIITSSDGEEWTSYSNSSFSNIKSITYYDVMGLYFAVGDKIIVSSNGVDWAVDITPSQSLSCVQYLKPFGILMAVGNKGLIVTSNDGTEWKENKELYNIENINRIIYSKGLYITVGDSIIVSNENEETELITISNELFDITYSDSLDLFVAVGSEGTILTSSNRTTWTNRNSGVGSTELHGVTYSEEKNLFIAVGKLGTIIKSSDGINWTTVRNSGEDFDELKRVIYVDNLGLFIAVGYNSNILTSPDGTTWTSQNTPMTVGLLCICYSERLKLLVAIGDEGEVLTSYNGVIWVRQANSIEASYRGIIYSDKLGLFIAGGSKVMASSDGVDWGRIDIPNTVNDIIYSDKQDILIAVGNGGIIYNSVYVVSDNLINYLSTKSNMGLKLEVGENEILFSKDSGSLTGIITYRQKYIGV